MNFFCFALEGEIESDIASFTFNACRSSSAVNLCQLIPPHWASQRDLEFWVVSSPSTNIVTCQRSLKKNLETSYFLLMLEWIMQEKTSKSYSALKNMDCAVLCHHQCIMTFCFKEKTSFIMKKRKKYVVCKGQLRQLIIAVVVKS